ncbi:MAG: hypothetical protein OXG78_14125 [Chloroflexi bacterium]|nr:hypothetical protein [Chloroflexota bacterium]
MEMMARLLPLKIEARLLSRASTRYALHRIFVRASLWHTLRRHARHPIAAHFSRQLKQGRRVNILPFSLVCALLLFFAFAHVYNFVSSAILWTLPLWLMLFSLSYCSIWIGRIVALMLRQTRAGVMDEVSMIPPGQAFVLLVIGKVVLNEGDALAWLTLLRRYLAGAVFFCFAMAFCIAATQVGQVNPFEFATMLAALLLVTLVIPLEHLQSTIIACLTAIIVCMRTQTNIDKASIAVAGFALLQLLGFALAIAVVIALEAVELSIMIALYLFIREILIAALWHLVLRQLNEDDFLLGPI